jgi:hypothetical protein
LIHELGVTEGREVINPWPMGYANIFRLQAPYSIGFVTYSEGCNDDVNKFIWSSLGWDREKPVVEILREYSGYFISDRLPTISPRQSWASKRTGEVP